MQVVFFNILERACRRLACQQVVMLVVPMAICCCAAGDARAQDTPDYFRQNCMNCHTIGGGQLTGPDLKDVTQRKDRAWLANFMANPKAVIDSGDPYAVKIFEESRKVPMPTLPGLTPD